MSVEANVTIEDYFFAGEDKVLAFHVKDVDGVPIDIGSWALRWVLRWSADAEAELLAKTTGGGGVTISGTYNVDPDVNAQRALVTVVDTDSEALTPRTYVHALKRTDDGSEAVLSHGALVLQRAAAR